MSVPLIEFILDLLKNEDAQKDFGSNPHGYLESAGLSDLCGPDVKAALPFVKDAGLVKPTHGDDDDDHKAPEHDDRDGHGGHGGDDDDVEGAIRYLKHITQNYTYVSKDDHSVDLDNSVNQYIWNKGELELEQHFDNDPTIASGDGAVAAGDDIEGTVTTGNNNTVVSGDGNVVGDGNAVGEDNNVANGANSAAGNGNVTGGTFGDGATVATTGGEADSSTNDSYNDNSDNSVENEDSYNDNSDHSVTIDDSGNTTRDSYNDESVEQEGLVNVNDTKVDVEVDA